MGRLAKTVVDTLRACEHELRAGGITLALFGSVARGSETDAADIDLAAAFDETHQRSLLDLVRIERRLAVLPGRPVELVQDNCLRPRMRSRFEQEAIRAF